MKKKALVYSENSYFIGYTNHLLIPNGFQIISISTFEELKSSLTSEKFTLVIFDTCVPNDLSLKITKDINCPVIILDSLKAHISLDYISPPILDLLDKFTEKKSNIVQITQSTFFDIGKHCIWKNEEYIPLSIQEFKIFYLLHLNFNNVVLSGELINYADLTSRSSLYVHINSLREKVEDNPGDPKIVQTKFGKGYLASNQFKENPQNNVVQNVVM